MLSLVYCFTRCYQKKNYFDKKKIKNISISQSVNKDLDNEAIRIVKKIPKWNLAKQLGNSMVTFTVIKTSINGVKSINAMFNEPPYSKHN